MIYTGGVVFPVSSYRIAYVDLVPFDEYVLDIFLLTTVLVFNYSIYMLFIFLVTIGPILLFIVSLLHFVL